MPRLLLLVCFPQTRRSPARATARWVSLRSRLPRQRVGLSIRCLIWASQTYVGVFKVPLAPFRWPVQFASTPSTCSTTDCHHSSTTPRKHTALVRWAPRSSTCARSMTKLEVFAPQVSPSLWTEAPGPRAAQSLPRHKTAPSASSFMVSSMAWVLQSSSIPKEGRFTHGTTRWRGTQTICGSVAMTLGHRPTLLPAHCLWEITQSHGSPPCPSAATAAFSSKTRADTCMVGQTLDTPKASRTTFATLCSTRLVLLLAT